MSENYFHGDEQNKKIQLCVIIACVQFSHQLSFRVPFKLFFHFTVHMLMKLMPSAKNKTTLCTFNPNLMWREFAHDNIINEFRREKHKNKITKYTHTYKK